MLSEYQKSSVKKNGTIGKNYLEFQPKLRH
jgi:hypothetical protein